MGKFEDEIKADIKALTTSVNNLSNDVNQIKFNLLRVVADIKNIETSGGGGSTESSGGVVTAAVDLGPIQERLDEITKMLIGKADILRIEKRLEDLASERIKETQETLSRVTALFQSGLEMVKLEDTLTSLKSLLEETVLSS
ncbi:MAG: hypothetical protein INQ03_08555 [Candidatus Heimdallarchaeota archaeon]|nr:hypothetical protein [Candidatus Heimdallarchaeota archaeon]